jgi:zinc-ribbon family
MIIFGTRGYVRALATPMLVCHRCGNPAAHRVLEKVTRFTLFFIPLFPVSTSRSLTCTFCGTTTPISRDLAQRYATQAQVFQRPTPQPFGQLSQQAPAPAPPAFPPQPLQ